MTSISHFYRWKKNTMYKQPLKNLFYLLFLSVSVNSNRNRYCYINLTLLGLWKQNRADVFYLLRNSGMGEIQNQEDSLLYLQSCKNK